MVTVDIVIGDVDRDVAMALVPKEKAHIASLQERGTIEAFYLSAERNRSWIVMRGETQPAIEAELRQFPMFRFLRPTYAALG